MVDNMGQRLCRGAAAIARELQVELPDDLYRVDRQYPMLASSYYLNLIERNAIPDDPISKQVIADRAELESKNWPDDGLGEMGWSPVPRVIRRYRDRALLLTTGRCAVHCRFCFRKRNWQQGHLLPDISDEELATALDYLQQNRQIQEVLLSGGDPLMLPAARLQQIIRSIDKISHIGAIRIGSRIPVTWPERLGEDFIKKIAISDKIWFMTHFNHPRELTKEAAICCKMLVKASIPVFNQTVLLRGVNDDSATLIELCHGLVKIKVKPHYLFHIDPIPGVWHFATGIKQALEIVRELRGKLSSLAMPTFAIDLPHGGGKVALQPDYRTGEGFITVEGKIVEHPGWDIC